MKKINSKNSLCDDAYKSYICRIKKIPLLSFEEEVELSEKIQAGDGEARKRLVEANLRLVVKIARTYSANDISLMDLIQEGSMGLMRGAEKFDGGRGLRFSTYAAWWIRNSISRYLIDKRRMIRLPYKKEEMLKKVNKAYNNLRCLFMRKPTVEEIAEESGMPKEKVKLILNFSKDAISLDSNSGGGAGAIEFLQDNNYNPEFELLKKSRREAAVCALRVLDEREKNVIICRYQLNGGKRHTLKNISEKMGLSKEAVRQIEFRSLRKLKNALGELQCTEAV